MAFINRIYWFLNSKYLILLLIIGTIFRNAKDLFHAK